MSLPRSEKVIFPRSLAIKVLVRVLSGHEALDEVLASVASDVPPSTLPWLQEVCSGTLRWKGRLDWILDSISFKKKPSGWLRKILLLSTYQLIAQDRVHAGAVVSETVSEVRSKEGEAPAKFANACLRKVSEHALQWRNLPFPAGGNPQEEAGWASLPEWLWKKLVKQQGLDWAKAYAVSSLERPTLWLRSKEDWKPEGVNPGPVAGSWQATSGGAVTERLGFQDGAFIVQDISSQLLIAEITSQVKEKGTSSSFTALDLCAAPGGKSVGLAWSGFQVTATDRVATRVPLLKQTVSRVTAKSGPKIEVLPWEEIEAVCGKKDLIWVDAPCSGTGIIRRHPDVRWLRQEKELANLIQTQRELLRSAWEKVPPGGFLAYSVCSVLKEEGPDALRSLELEKFLLKEWFLTPQTAPFGDGFWAGLLHRPR